MKLTYCAKIENPESHQLKVIIEGTKEASENNLTFFMPSWSPGSYLMREYGRNVRSFTAQSENGEFLYFEQLDKGKWQIDWPKSDLKKASNKFTVTYEVFCHELTVRTSHIDASHAFLHGPSIFMGLEDKILENPTLEVQFPPAWTKITTGLKDISEKREKFLYSAKNYDELIDCPLEIGCHETDGFMSAGKEHHLAWYGKTFKHKNDLKKDIKTVVDHISGFFGGVPYDQYMIITHLVPGLFGGLEHSNSTALQFCSTKFTERKGYLNWIELVAHEYFHTWNVKRIRPRELGPFNYTEEALTKMHWLTEGLTSCMDQLFVYRMGLSTQEEYLDLMKDNLNRYYAIPGRKFHTLEDSSFNSWIKLYRPDENHNNSSISYYLKGGLVFFVLAILMHEKGSSLNELILKLWKGYEDRPEVGYEKEEILAMIEELAGLDVCNEFDRMLSTTEEIDFESHLKKIGVDVEYDNEVKPNLGFVPDFKGDRVCIKSVVLDGPSYKSGLNAGDEIIAIDGMRILKSMFDNYSKFLLVDTSYTFTVSRLNQLVDVEVVVEKAPRKIKMLKSNDISKTALSLGV